LHHHPEDVPGQADGDQSQEQRAEKGLGGDSPQGCLLIHVGAACMASSFTLLDLFFEVFRLLFDLLNRPFHLLCLLAQTINLGFDWVGLCGSFDFCHPVSSLLIPTTGSQAAGNFG
jgi:hypothetical protein